MAELARTVWVEHDGVPTCFTAGSTPPAWATALITNPSAWAAHMDDAPELAEGATDDETPVSTEDAPAADENTDTAEVSIPPKAGPGSSAVAWAAYALSKGFAVEDDAKASEIRDALAEAGIPVE